MSSVEPAGPGTGVHLEVVVDFAEVLARGLGHAGACPQTGGKPGLGLTGPTAGKPTQVAEAFWPALSQAFSLPTPDALDAFSLSAGAVDPFPARRLKASGKLGGQGVSRVRALQLQ